MWRVGIDVGGTFTDLFAWEDGGTRQLSSKVLTTKHERALGVLNAIREAGIAPAEISHLMHGTTTATNALITRDYPQAVMITTDGFRDTIEIGRQHREALYDPYQSKPKPIIKRRFRYTIDERMDVKGQAVRPLDRTKALAIADKIKSVDIKSVAIAFIKSYVNAAHENQMRDIVLEVNPGIYCVTSADTRPVFREHGRFTTTAIRAATMPVMERYFNRLESSLKDAGFIGRLMILKSSGGITGVDYAKQHPEELIESGPAGGVAYAAYLSELKGDCPNIIHTDVGGTSFDVSIVENGKGLVTRDHEIEWEIPVIVPMLDIHSVGAGGGSIGWVDEGDSLRVGPHSAGSEPGPVCYGRGGKLPPSPMPICCSAVSSPRSAASCSSTAPPPKPRWSAWPRNSACRRCGGGGLAELAFVIHAAHGAVFRLDVGGAGVEQGFDLGVGGLRAAVGVVHDVLRRMELLRHEESRTDGSSGVTSGGGHALLCERRHPGTRRRAQGGDPGNGTSGGEVRYGDLESRHAAAAGVHRKDSAQVHRRYARR